LNERPMRASKSRRVLGRRAVRQAGRTGNCRSPSPYPRPYRFPKLEIVKLSTERRANAPAKRPPPVRPTTSKPIRGSFASCFLVMRVCWTWARGAGASNTCNIGYGSPSLPDDLLKGLE
jgi:hypothetical protein